MGDEPNEKHNSPKDFMSTKAAIFETFDKLKKWREEQVEQFRNMQLLENEKLNHFSDGNKKHLGSLTDHEARNLGAGDSWKKDFNDSSIASANEIDGTNSSNTLQESSISGHLQRCFDDSSQSNLSVSGNKFVHDIMKLPLLSGIQKGIFSEKILNAGKDKTVKSVEPKSTESKPKRPFLKKGTGLLRYMPKSSTHSVRSKTITTASGHLKKSACLPQRTLKLKPSIRTSSAPTGNIKHIRFDIPGDNRDISDLPEFAITSTSAVNNHTDIDQNIVTNKLCEENIVSPDKLEDNTNSINEILNLSKENKELEEFELLENFAQNSSFNSDSSIVQRVLHGEAIQAPKDRNKLKNFSYENVKETSSKENLPKTNENSIFSAKIGLSKCLEEVHARKQILQKVLSDINPRIQSLQKEISNCNQDSLDDSDISERCSTPVENLSSDVRQLPTVLENTSVDIPTSDAENEICDLSCKSCNVNDVLKDLYPCQSGLKEIDSLCEVTDTSPESSQVVSDKLRIRAKVEELEKEIGIYQEHNKKLSSICKERDEILRKLQKERDDFNKYKEAEKKKLETEIQEERKQIKRQKDTFARYQKLRKDNPTRKEREELNALRQEIEKLQEELKRQKIKYANDCRRMKNQLDAAERERDSFKLENIRLEEQVQDLLAALKARLKNNPEMLRTQNNNNINEDKSKLEEPADKVFPDVSSKTKESPEKQKMSNPSVPIENFNKTENPKVHFDLTEVCNQPKNADSDFVNGNSNTDQVKEASIGAKPPFQNIFVENETVSDLSENSEQDIGTKYGIQKECFNLPGNLSNISITIEAEFREIIHGNKIERIYNSGEREIIFNSGTRKVIGTDGKIKTMFYNGDTKEIFPDKREIYKYVNGVVETHFPDGLEVTEFPNGQIQRCYPDGQKEVKFPDGTMHNIYADGSEEIKSADGNVVNLNSEGTETIVFANGQKEIRTSTYRRREFPDGSVKIFYDSGRQETRYSNGRIRIKDKEGKIIVDTKYLGIMKG